MRNSRLGYIKNIEKNSPKSFSLKLFNMMSKIRNFELEVKSAHKLEKTTPLVYLSLGQEAVAAGIFSGMQNSYVLTQHRGHAHYLSKGGDLKKLNRMTAQLAKIEAIGGFKSIVPSEGLVFIYKGNTYKLTGAFAPINQITGMMTF